MSYVYFCVGKYEESISLIDEIFFFARCLFDKLAAYRTLCLTLLQKGKHDEAVETCMDVLNQLGIHVPRRMPVLHIILGSIKVQRLLSRYSDEQLLSPVPMPTNMMIDKILNFTLLLTRISFISFRGELQVMSIITTAKVVISNGWRKCRPNALQACGLLFLARSDYDRAFHFVEMAVGLAKEGMDVIHDTRTILVANLYILHFKKPYHSCLEACSECAKVFEEVADPEDHFLSLTGYASLYYLCGYALRPLEKDIAHPLELIADYGQIFYLGWYRVFANFILTLLGTEVSKDFSWGAAMKGKHLAARSAVPSHDACLPLL